MGTTVTETIDLALEECYTCGTPFAISSQLQRNLQNTGKGFYCPLGHCQVYRESTESKLKRVQTELENAKRGEKFWHQEAEVKAAELKITRSNFTKLKNRVAKGVCPCCHRQFVNLQKHMESKHPKYSASG